MSSLIPYLGVNPLQQALGSGVGPFISCAQERDVVLSASEVCPEDAANVVDVTFPGFAFEERSLVFYAGAAGESPNNFSQNLIDEVGKRTGTKPVIRVGGTSLDHSSYNANQIEQVIYPEGQDAKNVPQNLSFGPSYFDSFAHLQNIQFIFDIPLAKDNLSNAVAFAMKGYSSIQSTNIEQLEVGNEPNFYPGSDRPASYSPSDYVQDWVRFTDSVSAQLGPNKKYQAVGIANAVELGSKRSYDSFNIQRIFQAGLDQYVSRIESVSYHYYQTVATNTSSLQAVLMNHTAIVEKMKPVQDLINFIADYPPLKVNLGEVGSALNPKVNNFALENTFGAALWQIDLMLYAMSIGVYRVNMQSGIGFGFALWQPIAYKDSPPEVHAPYYAQVFVADWIGVGTETRVVNIDLGSDTLSAYAGYSDNKLVKTAILNLEKWDSPTSENDGQSRNSTTIWVPVPSGVSKASISRLVTKEGASSGDPNTISWAGESWTYTSDGIGQKNGDSTAQLTIISGKVRVTVPASEAVIVRFEY